MNRKNIFWVISVFTVSLVLWACRKDTDPKKESDLQVGKLMNRLKENGGNVKNGTIQIADNSGNLQTVSLDWDAMQTIAAAGSQFYKVPFKTGNKESIVKLTIKSASEVKRESYSLVFQEKVKGSSSFEVRVMIETVTGVEESSGEKYTAAISTFFDLAGKKKSLWVSKNNNYKRLYDIKANNNKIRSNSISSNSELCAYFTVPIYEYICTGNQIGNNYNITCGYVRNGSGLLSACGEDGQSGTSGTSDPFDYIIYFGGSGGVNSNLIANKNIIDSLRGYPCAQKVLASMSSLNSIVNNLLREVFSVNADVNITFKADGNLPADQDGELTNKQSLGTYWGTGWGEFTILLNKNILNNATEEYLLATYIHEALHAYMFYQKSNLSATDFNTSFPIYGSYNGNDPQHNSMAATFFTSMENALKTYNPNLDSASAKAFVWAGLYKTDLWKIQSDTIILRQKNMADRNVNDTISYGHYHGTKCN